MIHLLAYLLIRHRDKTWSVSSHRHLEGLTSDWEVALQSDTDAVAIIHVGFWRPDPAWFESVCSEHQGRVLLTETTKLALPQAFLSSKYPCGSVNNLPLYLALSGWGYSIDDPYVNLPAPALPNAPVIEARFEIPREPTDWLRKLQLESPELFASCSQFSIMSEELYQHNEHLLPDDIRNQLGYYRFKSLAGYPLDHNFKIDQLLFAPPWLLNLSVCHLDLTVRARNCLSLIRVESVGDIARIGEMELMRVENLGRKTLDVIARAIFQAFKSGSAYCQSPIPMQGHFPDSFETEVPILQNHSNLELLSDSNDWRSEELPGMRSFLEAIHASLASISKRAASVLRQRMGVGGSKMTLEEIGQKQFVTRERIRQIEKKAVTRIASRMPCWAMQFKQRLESMLEGRTTPLPLEGLDVLDPWFAGVDTLLAPFEYALDHFISPPEFYLVRIAELSYLTKLRQEEWNQAERASRELLASLSGEHKALTESEARLLVESQLVGSGEELRPLLWTTVTRWAHFSEERTGDRILVSYGMGAESLVEAVLSDSDTPLHFSDIAKRCVLRGRPIDLRRAANAAANVGYLLGRGIYGLQNHINLSSQERSLVLGEVEQILSEAPDRQWHAGEIIDELEARGLDFEGRLSKYDLNVILESSKVLAYLGRMVWTMRAKSTLKISDRLNIWQAIVALVQQHGSPMSAADIRDLISKDRGLGSAFQIHQADPLIRVGENEWGVLWRDVPFSEGQASIIVEELIAVLVEKGVGIHKSEIVSSLKANRDLAAGVNPNILISLAIRSGRVKSGMGGYIYLASWEGTRRMTVGEAVESAFDSFERGVLAAEVAKKASEMLGREVTNNSAAGILMKIATYDATIGLWIHPEEVDDASDLKASPIDYC